MHKSDYAGMNGKIVISPAQPDGDLGVLFIYNVGWSTMCGHGIIALVTVLLDARSRPSPFPDLGCERLAAKGELRIDAPAGQVIAQANLSPDRRRVTLVAFRNVLSFVYVLDQATVAGEANVAGYRAVIPDVSGRVWVIRSTRQRRDSSQRLQLVA